MYNAALIQENISLKDKNWFRTGGLSRYFCQPTNAEQFQEAIQFARQNVLDIFLLGKGANILVSDEGFKGITICPKLTNITYVHKQDMVYVTAGAGVDLHTLILYCFENNIVGLEEFSGIPSTVGGAVYINLHYFEFLLEHFLVHAQVIHAHTGKLMVVDKSWFEFSYNTSRLHKRDYYLASATFALKAASDQELFYARGRHVEIIRHREKRYPAKNTCGSFFRNFYEQEVSLLPQNKIIFVAYYLDKVGVKGNLSVGDAQVSHQHANMIVNRGNATSNDILQLAQLMQKMVYQEFGILPQPECQLIGFSSDPFMNSIDIPVKI